MRKKGQEAERSAKEEMFTGREGSAGTRMMQVFQKDAIGKF